MKPLKLSDVRAYIRQNIGTFHANRLQRLTELKLDKILQRKNPYLFKAKNILVANDLVRTLLDAHLSSQEEAIFGNFLEGLAIFVNNRVFGGKKSSAEGIDLEFDRDGKRYVVSVKSGPNWGNSRQVSKMAEDFRRAKRVLRSSGQDSEIVAVNGCCYGRDSRPYKKGDYFKYCGQCFWEFISGSPDLYLQLVVPLGHKARQRNREFLEEYSRILNRFTLEFSQRFCKEGKIDWDALVRFNSAASKPVSS